MDVDVVNMVVPYVAAAAGAYGSAVLEKVRDQAVDTSADATVGLGRSLIRRILGGAKPEPVETAILDLAGNSEDPDRVAAVRRQVRIALEADPALAAEIGQMLKSAGVSVSAIGSGAVAVQSNAGIIQTGHASQADRHYS